MMSNKDQDRIAPEFSGFLIWNFRLIVMDLNSRQYVHALEKVRTLISFCDPAIKTNLKDQRDLIESEIMSVTRQGGLNSSSMARSQYSSIELIARTRIYDILEATMDAIHDEGYFFWEKGGWVTLNKGKKSGKGDKTRENVPFMGPQGRVKTE